MAMGVWKKENAEHEKRVKASRTLGQGVPRD